VGRALGIVGEITGAGCVRGETCAGESAVGIAGTFAAKVGSTLLGGAAEARGIAEAVGMAKLAKGRIAALAAATGPKPVTAAAGARGELSNAGGASMAAASSGVDGAELRSGTGFSALGCSAGVDAAGTVAVVPQTTG